MEREVACRDEEGLVLVAVRMARRTLVGLEARWEGELGGDRLETLRRLLVEVEGVVSGPGA